MKKIFAIIMAFSLLFVSLLNKESETPFRLFIKNWDYQSQIETKNGYTYTLKNGILTVKSLNKNKGVIWQSDREWYITAFALGDYNKNGFTDITFTLWKKYSFGKYVPFNQTNDPERKCHIWVYENTGISLYNVWCSSNLPRAVYSFTLNDEILTMQESEYDSFKLKEYKYYWDNWGFMPF
ncbi:MAG: hypothetical protein LBM93_06860 [Oscillospiraceae bacterium]|jgi:hypothetical protein|nr:hypothetical protein [Oscillospiraceae bacterium]